MNGQTKAYVALALVCFFWGTTFLAARIGVSGFPALFFMGTRNVVAGLLLLAFLMIKDRSARRTWNDVKLQIIPGLGMITFGTGIVGWCVQYIPSGLAALIYTSIPLFTILVNLAAKSEERINKHIASGVLLGLAGIMLVFKDNLEYLADRQSSMGIWVALGSCVSWCLAGLYVKKHPGRTDPFFNAAIQMTAGGLGLFTLSAMAEDWGSLPPVSLKSLLALIYLILFGSILTFGAYLYAMSKLPAGLVSIYAYVNPLVALILGALVLDEQVTWLTALAFMVTMGGVFMVNFGYQLQKKKQRALNTYGIHE
jgi:drug/metabolite transporter (DMT)-like permease